MLKVLASAPIVLLMGTSVQQRGASMDVTSINSLSGPAAVGTGGLATSTSFLSFEALATATDTQLIALAAKGNTQATIELQKRDAARGPQEPAARQPEPAATEDTQTIVVPDTPNALSAARAPAAGADRTAPAGTPDTQTVLESQKHDAVEAARLQANADQVASTVKLDAETALQLEKQEAAHAAQVLANAEQTGSAPKKAAVGNIVDTFV
jgi:hypothetical protein